MKILKHSARFSLQVMDMSKVTSLLFCLANWFLDLPDFVRDRPSGESCFVGLCLGGMRLMHVSASVAQLFELIQPSVMMGSAVASEMSPMTHTAYL